MPTPAPARYAALADDLAASITRGTLLPGERLPSIRQARLRHGVSITTVLRAYSLLESRGLIESRPQSGHFVRQRGVSMPARGVAELPMSQPQGGSAAVDVSRLVLSTLRAIGSDAAVPLGSPYPDPSLFPHARLTRHAAAAGRRQPDHAITGQLPPGDPDLIHQIVRRYLAHGTTVDPKEVIITIGATEALNLCLQAVARPGDVVAVESPTYYAMLHAIERMGMRALEVATDPHTGIDLAALERLLRHQRIAACMVMPNFQNPLGFQMPEARKRALVALAARHGVPIIESDVYQALHFGDVPPTSLKTYDTQGVVLHCASFSKSLAPGYRIGWALAGRYRDAVEKLKFLNTLATPAIPQRAIAAYLNTGGYDRHLRRLRRTYAQQGRLMRAAVRRFLPAGTVMSQPMGGYVLWVRLPEAVDSLELYRHALEHGITLGPGYMFSATPAYRHYIRLNYSYAWSPRIEQALATIGRLAARFA